MKKIKVNYTDGTSKEVTIKRVNIAYIPESIEQMHLNIMGQKDEVILDATSNIIPDLKFVKNIEFLEADLPGGMS
jgi:hypothetical protein